MKQIIKVCYLFLIVFISGCAVNPYSMAPQKPTSTQIIYMACMPNQIDIWKQKEDIKSEEEAKAGAHYYCKIVAGACDKDPFSKPCKRDFPAYEASLNKEGKSLLYDAAYIGNERIVKSMLETDSKDIVIDYRLKGTNGWTSLLIATAEGHKEVVSLLIEKGANVNAANNLGRTPLMFAANYGFDSIAKTLIDNGAKIDMVPNDNEGWSALMAASYKGNLEIVKILVKSGANLKLRDKQGNTALGIAKKQGNTEIVNLLSAGK